MSLDGFKFGLYTKAKKAENKRKMLYNIRTGARRGAQKSALA
jgi:hypothetical protein